MANGQVSVQQIYKKLGSIERQQKEYKKYHAELEGLKKSVSELQSSMLRYKLVDDTQAQREIENYLANQKKLGVKKISIVEIVESLKLPIGQVDEIMEKLKSKGIQEVE